MSNMSVEFRVQYRKPLLWIWLGTSCFWSSVAIWIVKKTCSVKTLSTLTAMATKGFMPAAVDGFEVVFGLSAGEGETGCLGKMSHGQECLIVGGPYRNCKGSLLQGWEAAGKKRSPCGQDCELSRLFLARSPLSHGMCPLFALWAIDSAPVGNVEVPRCMQSLSTPLTLQGTLWALGWAT